MDVADRPAQRLWIAVQSRSRSAARDCESLLFRILDDGRLPRVKAGGHALFLGKCGADRIVELAEHEVLERTPLEVGHHRRRDVGERLVDRLTAVEVELLAEERAVA